MMCPKCGAKVVVGGHGMTHWYECEECGPFCFEEPNSKKPEENLVVEKCDPRN